MRTLVDTYGRKIDYLRISVTDRCNLRCIYCMPESGVLHKGHEAIVTYAEIVETVKAAALRGIKKIRITGGEPLVRKGIVDLVKDINNVSGIEEISLTTNGMLLAEYAYQLKEAGLKRINISLDSLIKERCEVITRRDALSSIMAGIEKAAEAGFDPIKINVVVIKGINDDEIEEFARLTHTRPFHVRFIEFMPIGDDSIWGMERFLSNSAIKERCEKIGNLVPRIGKKDGGHTESYKIEGFKGTVSFISPISSSFCSSCNRLRLTSDGKLRLCLGSPKEIDLLPFLRGGEFDGQGLIDAFDNAASLKPKGHHFDRAGYVSNHKTMCQIGG